ncbi:MAG: hypothetical protein ACOWWO_12050 [Peptococcaceae bacterium]
MYLKIQGNLLDILGEDARSNMEETLGIKVSPAYQFLECDIPATLAVVTNEDKVQKIINHAKITILNTMDEFNAEIDNLYEEKYTLTNSTELQVDLQLSGNPTIPNYDAGQPLRSQNNLKALYDSGLGGISKNKKPPYLTAQ